MHYVPQKIYEMLGAYIEKNGSLQAKYSEYLKSVNEAAKATGQDSKGRGSHGLKTAFAHSRYRECVRHGFSHERALQQVALELAHNRFDITLIYTKG